MQVKVNWQFQPLQGQMVRRGRWGPIARQTFPTLSHRYLWTGQVLLIVHPPFFLTSIFFHVYNILQICQKPGMDRNYCLIVFIAYMSYSDTQKVAKCCTHETKIDVEKKGGWAIRGTIYFPPFLICIFILCINKL